MPAAAFALILVLATAGCSPEQDEPAESASGASAPEVSTGAPEVLASGLQAPWSIAFHNGTPLVSERGSARILELDTRDPDSRDRDIGGPATGANPREVGIINDAAGRGEGGLLGIAVRDGFLYTFLSADEENRIERRELTGEPGSLGLGPPEIILEGIEAGPIHNGGRIGFGPDGLLYATTGDAGNPDSAQDTGSLNGKILRLSPNGGIPEDNPFPGSPVYSYGHRNPQGIAWDADGVLYASEFGQNTWDELNVIEPGGNYGWPEAEGIADEDGFTDPVQQWTPAEASPSGIAVAGETLYIANLRGEVLRSVPLDDLGTAAEQFSGDYGRLRDVVTAPDGSLWVLTNNTDGRGNPGPDDDRLLRLTPS